MGALLNVLIDISEGGNYAIKLSCDSYPQVLQLPTANTAYPILIADDKLLMFWPSSVEIEFQCWNRRGFRIVGLYQEL